MENTNEVLTHVSESNVELLIAGLKKMKRAKEKINGAKFVRDFVSLDEDNTEIREWFEDNGVMNGTEFHKLIIRLKHEQVVVDDLGFYPKTPSEFVHKYVEHQNITMKVNRILQRKDVIKLGENIITDEDRKDREVDQYYRLRSEPTLPISRLFTELKVKRDNLDLKFHDSQISSAIDLWTTITFSEVYANAIEPIMYKPGKATGPVGQQMWIDMEDAAFNIPESEATYAIKIIQKFMWQVKRKALKLPITNHLMPVLVGAQGKGKSNFVDAMLAPIADATIKANFEMVSEQRNIDIWRSLVMVFDEMSGAKKADMETVKSTITASSLERRRMGSNGNEQIAQMSTFIGSSNQALSSIIRDTTGLRRFAELPYTLVPDFDTLNKIDWLLLWQSVDEQGADPSLDIIDLLKEKQEESRNLCSVELWASLNGMKFRKATLSQDIYLDYEDWAKRFAAKEVLSWSAWGIKMGTLMLNSDFKWEKKRSATGQKYVFVG